MRKFIGAALVLSWLMAESPGLAYAVIALREVVPVGNDGIRLVFDSNIEKVRFTPEYLRDIVQFSIKGSSVYPAKVVRMGGKDLKKVFAYQYSPQLVRARLTVDGDAERFKGRIHVEKKGNVVVVRVSGESPLPAASAKDRLILGAAQAAPARGHAPSGGGGAPSADTAKSVSTREAPRSAEENVLLEKVLNAPPSKSEVARGKSTGRDRITEGTVAESKSGNARATAWAAFGKVLGLAALLLGGFGLLAWLASKAASGALARLTGKPKAARLVERVARGAGGLLRGTWPQALGGIFGRAKGNMIEVVASHHIAPKRTVTVVRVKGKLLVLGVTEESINLITQLGHESELDMDADLTGAFPESVTAPRAESRASGATAGNPFSKLLETEFNHSMSDARGLSAAITGVSAQASPIRDRIRKRVEGMKAL